ncbi:alpha/beta hydrolase [Primorskyibacter marinus]|uniref:alpha/beta hydrolase n=1 Tax=Primorskyibacter marinus TaxID=1977320 RepID=UPI000E300606|nr:alpha/beta hydrolase [Primorskyibacter marinus]
MSLRSALLNHWLRLTEKRHLARATTPQALRVSFERKARFFFHAPKGSAFQRGSIAEVPVLWVSAPEADDDLLILYFHGGGYVFGSPRTHRAMLAWISSMCSAWACLPDYRLAPEHAFPAPVEDAVAIYTDLLDGGTLPDRIILGGDSAGGGLALALLAEICRQDLPRPAGCFAFSPLTDLRYAGASIHENADSDVVLPAERVDEMADMYLQGADPDDPRASPLHGDFTGACPVWLAASDTEILLDDTRRMAEVLRAQGVEVEVEIKPNMPHVWPLFRGLIPEADATLRRLAKWITRLARPSNGS